MKRAVILQHRLLHYRTELFERLRAECLRRGIELHLVHGQAPERAKVRNDEGSLPWAHAVRNTFFEVGSSDLMWQPYPPELRDADLVILMQENKLLSNYPWMLARLWSARKIGYWGHGKNFQSDAPSGLREYWKSKLLTKVDWWFAYTEMTVDILRDAGYPENQVTVLNNAVDSAGFRKNLASWSDADVQRERLALGLQLGAKTGLFCGSLYPDKKLNILLDSADQVRSRLPDFALLVIGDGPSMGQLQEAAKTRPWLHLLGVRKGREKALYFRMADVMLNPGLVGLHVVDAFCGGLVMITTRGARHSPEVIYLKDGVNGLVTDDDAPAYGRAVTELLLDEPRLARLRAAALAESEVYTLENMVTRFADGIAAALASGKPR